MWLDWLSKPQQSSYLCLLVLELQEHTAISFFFFNMVTDLNTGLSAGTESAPPTEPHLQLQNRILHKQTPEKLKQTRHGVIQL